MAVLTFKRLGMKKSIIKRPMSFIIYDTRFRGHMFTIDYLITPLCALWSLWLNIEHRVRETLIFIIFYCLLIIVLFLLLIDMRRVAEFF